LSQGKSNQSRALSLEQTMTTPHIYDVIIAGSGPAGLAAALYTARAEHAPLVLEGPTPGGQLTKTSFVHNWPGTRSIVGVELIMNMKEHAQHYGAVFKNQIVQKLERSNTNFTLTTDKEIYHTKTVIFAVGAGPKKLGCPGEQEYWGKGVTACALCDGALYKNQPVVIVGGGDTAMEDALFMAKITNQVTIVHILDKLTASPTLQKLVLQHPHIKIIYTHTVTHITGDHTHVTHITIQDTNTKQETVMATAAVFLAIGLKPNTDFLKNILELDSYGYIKTKEPTSATNIPGIFAAGDAVDYRYRQAITAAAGGCIAAIDVQRYLNPQHVS
jgi:thioredoxin reductase (NADPH)